MPRSALALLLAALLGLAAPARAQDITARDLTPLVASHRGKVLVLNFWATWCGPCLKEMPELARLRAAYPGGRLAVVGVSLDYDPEAMTRYLARHPLPYPSFRDAGGAAESLGVTQIPRTLIFDPTGRLRADLVGETSLAELRRHIDPLLAP